MDAMGAVFTPLCKWYLDLDFGGESGERHSAKRSDVENYI